MWRTVEVVAGEDAIVPPFGNIKSGLIEIFKFNDTNQNRTFDSDERGLAGWNFTVNARTAA